MQGPFNVWQQHKRDHKIIDIRFKPMQRHLFLYEQSLIFCKKINKEDLRSPDQDGATYIYKSSINVSVKQDASNIFLWF